MLRLLLLVAICCSFGLSSSQIQLTERYTPDVIQWCDYYPTNVQPTPSPTITATTSSSPELANSNGAFTPLVLRQMNYFSHCNLTMTFSISCKSIRAIASTRVTLTIPRFRVTYCNNLFAIYFADELGLNVIPAGVTPISNSIFCNATADTSLMLWNFELDPARISAKFGSQCSSGQPDYQYISVPLTLETINMDEHSPGQANVPVEPQILLTLDPTTSSPTPAPPATTSPPSSASNSAQVRQLAPSPLPSTYGPVWRSLSVSTSASNLLLAFTSYNTFNLNGSPGSAYPLINFFFDLDDNSNTGYHAGALDSIGSELLLQGTSLYKQTAGVFNSGYLGEASASATTAVSSVIYTIPLSLIRSAVNGTISAIRVVGLNEQTYSFIPSASSARHDYLWVAI